jgi:hypothetical protein
MAALGARVSCHAQLTRCRGLDAAEAGGDCVCELGGAWPYKAALGSPDGRGDGDAGTGVRIKGERRPGPERRDWRMFGSSRGSSEGRVGNSTGEAAQ